MSAESKPEVGISDSFQAILDQHDADEQRYNDARARRDSASNPLLRVIASVNVRRRAAALEDTQTLVVTELQRDLLHTGEMPMFED